MKLFSHNNQQLHRSQTKRHKTDGSNNKNINVSNIDNKESDN